jgi:hypothetical protein
LLLCALQFNAGTAFAVSREKAVITALKISHSITGGFLSPSDSEGIFQNMVSKVQTGDMLGAAQLATTSKYFGTYLGRRLALQMQNLPMDASASGDNDATAFIIAHFVGGAGTRPSISTIWSENATYLVNATHAASLTQAQVATVDWRTDMSRVAGQKLRDPATATGTLDLPLKHVGGFMTLSDRPNDRSFAMSTASAGTNLRMVVGLWKIATGLELLETAFIQGSASHEVPRFVPKDDPNFLKGQGQPACISCHGGGMVSLSHGYSTFADIFDFTTNKGLTYIASPTTGSKKSLGSDAGKRAATSTCNLSATPAPVCNPDGTEAFSNQRWDLKPAWEENGLLERIGWRGATSGEGLNSLGIALGKADIVYEFLAQRVAKEICPTGNISEEDLRAIGAKANYYASPQGTDDIRTIVSHIAIHAECLGEGG